jgi:hypothetical protein
MLLFDNLCEFLLLKIWCCADESAMALRAHASYTHAYIHTQLLLLHQSYSVESGTLLPASSAQFEVMQVVHEEDSLSTFASCMSRAARTGSVQVVEPRASAPGKKQVRCSNWCCCVCSVQGDRQQSNEQQQQHQEYVSVLRGRHCMYVLHYCTVQCYAAVARQGGHELAPSCCRKHYRERCADYTQHTASSCTTVHTVHH